jgi:uncharacterized membrane protein
VWFTWFILCLGGWILIANIKEWIEHKPLDKYGKLAITIIYGLVLIASIAASIRSNSANALTLSTILCAGAMVGIWINLTISTFREFEEPGLHRNVIGLTIFNSILTLLLIYRMYELS